MGFKCHQQESNQNPTKAWEQPVWQRRESLVGSLLENLICTQMPVCLPKGSDTRMQLGYLEALKSNYGDKSYLNLQTSLESGNAGEQG